MPKKFSLAEKRPDKTNCTCNKLLALPCPSTGTVEAHNFEPLGSQPLTQLW